MEGKRTVVFIDYDNVWISCKEEYDIDILDNNFTNKIKKYLTEEEDLKLLEMIAYGNFDNGKMATDRHQTLLQRGGIQTRHVMNGKDSADIAIVCDALEKLYLNKEIDNFVIASCDRDITSLVNKIKSQGKNVYLLPLAVNIDWDVISNYGDKHIWFEKILDIPYTEPIIKPELNEDLFLSELDNEVLNRTNDINYSLFCTSLLKKYNTTKTKIHSIKDQLLVNDIIDIYTYEFNGKKFNDGIKRKS